MKKKKKLEQPFSPEMFMLLRELQEIISAVMKENYTFEILNHCGFCRYTP